MGAEYSFNSGIFIGADINSTDDYFIDPANTEPTKTPQRTLVNARIGYEEEHWGAFVYARNAFDLDYYNQAIQSRGEIDMIRAGEPRTLGLVFNLYL